MTAAIDHDLLELDPKCPACRRDHYIDDCYDGHEAHCYFCDRLLVAVEYVDGTMAMRVVYGDPPPVLTGRQRARRLWAARGRR